MLLVGPWRDSDNRASELWIAEQEYREEGKPA